MLWEKEYEFYGNIYLKRVVLFYYWILVKLVIFSLGFDLVGGYLWLIFLEKKVI